MKAIVLVGVSGSGKDTIFSDADLPIAKFSSFAKRDLEEHFGIPHRSLEDREFRQQKIEGADISYLDYLVAYHGFLQKTLPSMYFNRMDDLLSFFSECGKYMVVFNDVRSVHEAGFILDYFGAFNVRFVHLVRPAAVALPSDSNLPDILTFAGKYLTVMNNGDINLLKKTGRELRSSLFTPRENKFKQGDTYEKST